MSWWNTPLVDAGDGIRLMLHDTGSSGPPVICLSCAGGAHEEWSAVTTRLDTRVLTYGRPSLGGSDPLPAALVGRRQTIRWPATQLRTLLHNAEIAPPYVLLTSSIGGWIADQYAATWPDEVAGMVLVDPTGLSPWPKLDDDAPIVDGDDNESGGIRLGWKESYAELARSVPPCQPRRVVVSASDGHMQRRPPRSRWWEPLTLAEVDQVREGFQREWTHRLFAQHVVADHAGHFVHRHQPDLVAHVVRAVLDAARSDGTAALSAADVAGAGGQLRPTAI